MSGKSEAEIFAEACACFDARDFFEAHELWEELWHEASGKRHPYLQGLIQTAVGFHHAGNNNINGARKLFAGALGYLERGKDSTNEIDVDQVRELILDVEIALQKRLAGETVELPIFKLPFVR